MKKVLFGMFLLFTTLLFGKNNLSLVDQNGEHFDTIDDFYMEEGAITGTFLTPDKKIAISLLYHTINIYDFEKKQLLNKLGIHKSSIATGNLSQGGNFFVSLSEDGVMKVWDIKKLLLIKTLKSESSLMDILITKNGKELIYSTSDGKIIIQDIETEKIVKTLQHNTKTISSMSLSLDETILVSASWSKSIKIWDLKKKALLKTIHTKNNISDIVISKNNDTLITSSYLNIKVWSMEGKLIQTLDSYPFKYTILDLSIDGTLLISLGKEVKVWKKEKQKFKLIHKLTTDINYLSTIEISSDNKIATIGNKILDLKRGVFSKKITNYTDTVESLKIKDDGRTLISGSNYDRFVWDIKDGRLKSRLKTDINALDTQSHNGNLSLSYIDGNITVKDTNSNKVTKFFPYDISQSITAKAISNDGETIIFGLYNRDILVWKKDSLKPILYSNAHDEYISSIVIDSNGDHFVSASRDKSIKIWDLKKSVLVKILSGHKSSVNCLFISDDGKYIVSGSGGNFTNLVYRKKEPSSVKLWGVEKGNLIKTFYGHKDSIDVVTISPNNQYIASSSMDGRIKLWDREGHLLKELVKDNKDSWVIFDDKKKIFFRLDDGRFLMGKKKIYKNGDNFIYSIKPISRKLDSNGSVD